MTSPDNDPTGREHGNVFGRGWGNMFIHVQRESGLAHRTLVLRPWQVQALRLVVSKWFAAIVTIAVLSWGYFAVQTSRMPFLTRRITHLEQDAAKIDTLQATLEQLQRRYDQVQQMLSAAAKSTSTAAPGPDAGPGRTADKPAATAPSTPPVQSTGKSPTKTPSPSN